MDNSVTGDTKPTRSEPTPPRNATPAESKAQSAPDDTPNNDNK